MKKWIFSILLAFVQTPTHAHDHLLIVPSQTERAAFFSPEDSLYFHPDAVRTGYLAVKAMKINGFNGECLKKLEIAFSVMEEVVNSEEFKERVINFKNRQGQRKYASNKGLSNEQIYETFMEGREILQPDTPGEMNFYLRLYHNRWSRVIGYTSPNTNMISVNWKFFRNYRPNDVAGNLAHEWLHKLGFDHTSAAEHDSVPYAIGYIVEELAAKRITLPTQRVARL
jgi:hypothetical protein